MWLRLRSGVVIGYRVASHILGRTARLRFLDEVAFHVVVVVDHLSCDTRASTTYIIFLLLLLLLPLAAAASAAELPVLLARTCMERRSALVSLSRSIACPLLEEEARPRPRASHLKGSNAPTTHTCFPTGACQISRLFPRSVYTRPLYTRYGTLATSRRLCATTRCRSPVRLHDIFLVRALVPRALRRRRHLP